MKLSSLISEGLVLQRGCENKIWGKCELPVKEVTVTLFGKGELLISSTGRVAADGSFCVTLLPIEPGGPYTLEITADENRIINNIYCGDVFLLAGQSNMELPLNRCMDLYEAEINGMELPDIHLFEVPKEHAFKGPVPDIYEGSWLAATNDNVKKLSALGIFYAKLHQEKYHVPVGLVQTAVGGTHIESYISESSLLEVGKLLREEALKRGEDISTCSCGNNDSCKICYEKRLIRNKDDRYVEETKKADILRQSAWFEWLEARDKGKREHWENKDFAEAYDGILAVPGMWENLSDNKKLETLRGSVWVSKKVYIKKEWVNKEIRMYLGTIMDTDETYVNGVLVGKTDYRYPPRRYRIAAGILKEGENIITVKVTAYARSGGFVPEMPYCLSVDESLTDTISLEGEWFYKIGADKYGLVPIEELNMKDITFFNWQPTAMYNQMVYPVRNISYKALLFYQGENNVSHPWEYEYLLIQMIKDIRAITEKTLPVGIVELPKFGGEDEFRGGNSWEEIRQSQERAASKIENCVIADIYELGFIYELHPQTKKEAAQLLFNQMQKIIN